MKYFTYKLIAAANGWTRQRRQRQADAARRFEETVVEYEKSLNILRPRLSASAWQFFAKESMHDARLLTLSVGDGLDFRSDGSRPFRLNHQHTTSRILLLNYDQNCVYTLTLRGIESMRTELKRSDAHPGASATSLHVN